MLLPFSEHTVRLISSAMVHQCRSRSGRRGHPPCEPPSFRHGMAPSMVEMFSARQSLPWFHPTTHIPSPCNGRAVPPCPTCTRPAPSTSLGAPSCSQLGLCAPHCNRERGAKATCMDEGWLMRRPSCTRGRRRVVTPLALPLFIPPWDYTGSCHSDKAQTP